MPEDWTPNNLEVAMRLALTEEKVHLGVFFKEDRPVYEIEARQFERELQTFDLTSYLQRFA
jgi:hypothetical protein